MMMRDAREWIRSHQADSDEDAAWHLEKRDREAKIEVLRELERRAAELTKRALDTGGYFGHPLWDTLAQMIAELERERERDGETPTG